MSLGCASPWPQPPSRSWAMTGPAHLPELKPQQLDAQSESLEQGPVMNCVPGGLPEPVEVVVVEPVDAAGVVAWPWLARNFCAAMSLGWASPNPHPPSRSCAMTGPAHLPLLKPQHSEAQSASDWQGPVMNWVPAGTRGT